MGTDKNFPEIVKDLVANWRKQDHENHSIAVAGLSDETGFRVNRGHKTKHEEEEKAKKEQEKLLAIAAKFSLALFKERSNEIRNNFHAIDRTIDHALKVAEAQFNPIDKLYKDALSKASTLDGLKVFMDDDGAAYTLDKRKLSEEEITQVIWREDSPSWKYMEDITPQYEIAKKRLDVVIEGKNRMAEIHVEFEELAKYKTPESLALMEALNVEAEAIKTTINSKEHQQDFQSKQPQVTEDLVFEPMTL